ncbi:MAG: hypothetical protein HY718_00670 [Planctomycetes bacterium]|nr:hypothetical protein [Planctomycetota bacterium]
MGRVGWRRLVVVRWDELFSKRIEHRPETGEKAALPTGGGVYLLTDEQDRLVQLASAADLRRAVWTRLTRPGGDEEVAVAGDGGGAEEGGQGCPPPVREAAEEGGQGCPPPMGGRGVGRRRADLSQIVRYIRWQPTHSVFEATFEYHRIARQVLPETYLENLAFGPAWFVHVDPEAAIPRFIVGKIIPPPPGTTLGPFATQQDANRFVQTIGDAFDLCRYVHILEQVPHGQACAYFEMGRCPAPCDGSIPMSQYRGMMATALRFAAGERDAIRREWEDQMREAASGLAFERAAAIKLRLERIKELDHAAFRFVRPIDRFSWLIVQRGGGRTRVKPFFVRRGWIDRGEMVKLKDLDRVAAEWIARMVDRPSSTPAPEVSEHVWLASHFLFRRERMGLFLHPSELTDAAGLADRVRQAFVPERKPADAESSPPM